MDARELYVRLGRLIETMPVVQGTHGDVRATVTWLAQAAAVLNSRGRLGDGARLVDIAKRVGSSQYKTWDYTAEVFAIMQVAFAAAEIDAPADVSGTFIHAGSAFDALAALGNVISRAQSRLLIVDPYLDEKALTDFAVLANDKVKLHLLADAKDVKPSLSPAVNRWRQQYPDTRSLEARLAEPRTLHDRIIIIDDTEIWLLTQSLNAFAARAPASIIRSEGEAGARKREAYTAFWQGASPLT